MNRHGTIIFAAAAFVAAMAGGSLPAFAQAFQNYKCADGTQFIVGYYPNDSRARWWVGDAGPAPDHVRFTLCGTGRHVENHQDGDHAQARQTAGDRVRADVKRAGTFSFRPFFRT